MSLQKGSITHSRCNTKVLEFTKIKIKPVELFDFLRSIGAHVDFSGSFSSKNTYINAHICIGSVRLPTEGGSVYGRSEKPDIEEALANLAAKVSGKQLMMGKIAHQFPALKHTRGYR